MTSLREVETAAREGTLGDLTDALRSDPLSHRLARALRVDLAAIVADPGRALQTVWARGYFTPTLRGTLDRWREEHAGRPWARSLRPPAFPLSGPLEEEYRGDFAGAEAVSLTADAVTVVRGESATVVDRATGARRSVTAAAAPLWRVDLRADSGRCRIVDPRSGTVLVDLRVNDDDCYTTVAVTQGAVFAGGWYDDYDGVVARVDGGSVTWRWEQPGAPVSGISCTPDGSRVLVFSRGRLFVLDGAAGTTVHSGQVDAGLGALDPTGTRLVTVGDPVVRVWSLDRLGGPTVGMPGTGPGFAYAMWSPDGSRLLTGAALCEGATGRLVAALPMDDTGYPEGGPPPGARAVGDAEVVEFTPLRGMTLWDAHSGAPVAIDPDRCYSLHRDLLWIAPDARSYVHTRRDGGARLLRTRDGTELAAFGAGRMTAAAWSPDSSRLATAHDDGRVRIHGAVDHDLDTVDGGVTGLAFSCDGTVLAAGGTGTVLHLWDAAAGTPLGTAARDGRHPWRPSPDALALLHGRYGFRARRHPFHARHEAGFLVLEPDDPALPTYRVACDEPLVPDPAGTRWASPTMHVALENVSASASGGPS